MTQQPHPIRAARLSMAAIDHDSDEFDLDFTSRSGPQLITFKLGAEEFGVDKRSWQQRNRIISPSGELMFTMPVLPKVGWIR